MEERVLFYQYIEALKVLYKESDFVYYKEFNKNKIRKRLKKKIKKLEKEYEGLYG